MKVERGKESFREVTIVIETQKELDVLNGVLNYAPLYSTLKENGVEILEDLHNKLKETINEEISNYSKYLSLIDNYLIRRK